MKLTKKAMQEIQKEEAIKELNDLFEKYGYVVYTGLEHVSRSGMLRRISCFVKNNEGLMIDITHLVSLASIFNLDSRNKGLRVTGCGMDMGFHVVYSLSCAMYCRNGYDHDSAYKVKQRWL